MTKKNNTDSFSFVVLLVIYAKKRKSSLSLGFFFKYKQPANHYSIQTILRFSKAFPMLSFFYI